MSDHEQRDLELRAAWDAKWSDRSSRDPRLKWVAKALCRARGGDPDAPYSLPARYMDVVNPPNHLVWLQGEPNWMALRQEAFEFLAMTDAAIGSGGEET